MRGWVEVEVEVDERLSTDTILEHAGYVERAGGYTYRKDLASERSLLEVIFASPSNAFAAMHNAATTESSRWSSPSRPMTRSARPRHSSGW
ncbi:MAG: hypothetical protein WBV82_10475 [Myxococcaceae bacterium]